MTITRIGKKVLLIGPLLIIRLFCFVAFFYQTYTLINGMINPSETLISMQERNLSDIRFPLIFKICIKPGFNETEVMNLGYSTSWSEAKKDLLYLVQYMVLMLSVKTPQSFFPQRQKKWLGKEATNSLWILVFGCFIKKETRILTNRSMTVSNKALKNSH